MCVPVCRCRNRRLWKSHVPQLIGGREEAWPLSLVTCFCLCVASNTRLPYPGPSPAPLKTSWGGKGLQGWYLVCLWSKPSLTELPAVTRHHQVQVRKGVCAWPIITHREEKPLERTCAAGGGVQSVTFRQEGKWQMRVPLRWGSANEFTPQSQSVGLVPME